MRRYIAFANCILSDTEVMVPSSIILRSVFLVIATLFSEKPFDEGLNALEHSLTMPSFLH